MSNTTNTFTVTITECYGDRRESVGTYTADDAHSAVSVAVKKHYGNQTYFVRDAGMNGMGAWAYGQIGHAHGDRGTITNLITGRVRIDVAAQ